VASSRYRKIIRSAVLLAIIAACGAVLALTYQPRARFANPVTDGFPLPGNTFHCYHDAIYGGAAHADVLYFGASRTMFAVQQDEVSAAYRAVTGEDVAVFRFTTAWANPELAYVFFRDYLRHNPAPDTALFEFTATAPRRQAVAHVNPLYPYLAPFDLYVDELRSWEFVRGPLFGLSNFLRLHLRHIDLALNNLLVAGHPFLVPAGDNCATPAAEPVEPFRPAPDFDALVTAEADRLLPPGGWDAAGDYDLLLEAYADDPLVTRRLQGFGRDWTGRRPPKLWNRGPFRDRDLHYFRRILELGSDYGVAVGFYHLSGVYFPPTDAEHLALIERRLGAPVHVMPFDYARVSYHHYHDLSHVGLEARRLTSAWAASLIDAAETD